jgi:gamma-tubulin complex component 5
MAHTAAIGALVGDLIKAAVKTSSQAQLEQYKRAALRTLAESQSSRINQFDVHARLEGLVEKARILNNDPLADALHLRLTELSSRSDKWTPEALSLLLQLSDRPVRNNKVEDLVFLQPGPSSAPLTWSDIVADDPLDNQDSIWDNVDFAGDGSDEEEVLRTDLSDSSEHTPDSSLLDDERVEAKLGDLLRPKDESALHLLVDAQFWRPKARVNSTEDQEAGKDNPPELLLTEIQTMREVIFMLLGLPTTAFNFNANKRLVVSTGLRIRHVSPASIIHLLGNLAEIGDQLRIVRRWVRRETLLTLEQTFQAAIETRLGDLDLSLNEIQTRIQKPPPETVPSLLQLYSEVYRRSQFIQQTAGILMDLKPARPFGILECLYEKICANQSIGDTDGYEYMAKLFFECFQAYIRPVKSWMETGQLSKHDQVMFIRKKQDEVPLTSLWNDQYHLVREGNDNLYAPNFLHVAAMKIFNTGKSVHFLRHLGYEGRKPGMQTVVDPIMTFENVCNPADLGTLSPFPELFNKAFDTFIASSYHSSASMLRAQLEAECGLWRVLDALEYIYFFRNGALSTDIALKIFQRIDHRNARWNDNFALTEIFQETLSAVSCIDVDSLDVRSNRTVVRDKPHQARRSMGALEDLRVIYTLPWPIANIVKIESLMIYQHIFVLLTQLRRAKYLLQMQKLPKDGSPTMEKDLLLIYGLHHRLLWFTDTVLTYITDMVLLASTIDMRLKMMRAEDVDAMVAVHEAYISQLQSQCFFTKQHGPIRQAIMSLLDLTVLFSDIQASFAMQTTSRISENMQTRQRRIADSDSDDDGKDDYDAGETVANSVSGAELSNTERLKSMDDSFRKLHGYVTAAVQGISKAESGTCWEMLATSLAVGLGK